MTEDDSPRERYFAIPRSERLGAWRIDFTRAWLDEFADGWRSRISTARSRIVRPTCRSRVVERARSILAARVRAQVEPAGRAMISKPVSSRRRRQSSVGIQESVMAVSAAASHPQGEHAALHVPVRLLPDARLSLEPPAVCLRRPPGSARRRRKRGARRGREPERGRERRPAVLVGLRVEQRAERRRHQPHPLGHGRVAGRPGAGRPDARPRPPPPASGTPPASPARSRHRSRARPPTPPERRSGPSRRRARPPSRRPCGPPRRRSRRPR